MVDGLSLYEDVNVVRFIAAGPTAQPYKTFLYSSNMSEKELEVHKRDLKTNADREILPVGTTVGSVVEEFVGGGSGSAVEVEVFGVFF